MINKELLNKPLYLAAVMFMYGVALASIILLVSHFIDMRSSSAITLGGLSGALLAGTTYVNKTKSRPSWRLRLLATLYFFIVQVGLNIGFIIYKKVAIDNKLISFLIIMNLIYIAGVLFMVSLGASNQYKSQQRLKELKNNE